MIFDFLQESSEKKFFTPIMLGCLSSCNNLISRKAVLLIPAKARSGLTVSL